MSQLGNNLKYKVTHENIGKGMDRRVLILVVLIAVALIVFASLSPVVGYRNVVSNVKESPLFSIRTKEVNNEDINNKLISHYLGDEKEIDLHIPTRDRNIGWINKIINGINRLNRLDPEDLDILVEEAIKQMYQKQYLINANVDDITEAINKLMMNQEEFKKLLVNSHNDIHKNTKYSMSEYYTMGSQWIPTCLIQDFIIGMVQVFFLIIFFIYILFFGWTPPTTFCTGRVS